MSAVGVVLARAGSKGVPGKNVAALAGRPCVEWTIAQALASERLSVVLTSSDDDRVLEIAHRAGSIGIRRSAETAGDKARVDDAAREALTQAAAQKHVVLTDRTPIVLLYGNVPIRPDGLIDQAVDLLESSGADSVQSYAAVGKYHPWWLARIDPESGEVRPWEGEVLNHGVYRRQDLPPAFVPDGGVLVVTVAALFLRLPGVTPGPHAFFGVNRRGVITQEGAVIDIDSRYDLLVANAMLETGRSV